MSVSVSAADLETVLNQRVMHSHSRPGIWDADNQPGLANTRCVECAARERLRAELQGRAGSPRQAGAGERGALRGAQRLAATVTDLSDRIPLRDVPIAERLQQRLREAEERCAELHLAVTAAEAERDEARESREGMRDAKHRLGAEVVQGVVELHRLTVQREQLATVLAEVLRRLTRSLGGGYWASSGWISDATVQRWRDALGQYGEAVGEDAIRAAKASRCPSRLARAVGPPPLVWTLDDTDDDRVITGYGHTTPDPGSPTGDTTDATV